MRGFVCLLILTAACVDQIRDPAAVPRIPRNGLLASVVGCYELTLRPELPEGHGADLAPFERMELDSAQTRARDHYRQVHTERSAFARVYSVPPSVAGPIAALWTADSLTDSLAVFAKIGTGTTGARMVPRADGGLTGIAFHAWEYGRADLGRVIWKRRPCAGLDLDREPPF